jgi:hypothetical protein
MALDWQTAGDFSDRLWSFLRALEVHPLEEAGLKARLVGQDLTVGVGFDLRTGSPGLINTVLDVMGFFRDSGIAKEDHYVGLLRSAFKGTSDSALDAIMLSRRNDTDAAYGAAVPTFFRRPEFKFEDVDEVRDVFDDVWNTYRGEIKIGWGSVPFFYRRQFLGIA